MLFLYLTYQLNLHKHPGLLFLMDFSFESCSQVFPKLTLRYRDFRMSPNSHTCISFLIISISNESSVLVIVAKAMLPHHYQSPQLTLGFTLGGVPYMCLDKCIMTFIHYYNIKESIFIALKICALDYSSPTRLYLRQPLIFYCLHSLAFSSWNNTV